MALLRNFSLSLDVLFFAAGTVSARMLLTFDLLMDDPFAAAGALQRPLSRDRAYGIAELIDLYDQGRRAPAGRYGMSCPA